MVYASGAYDKGTAAGKGNFELNLTINPFNLVSYGQNYGILSYGIHDRVDLVSYYSIHKNGIHRQILITQIILPVFFVLSVQIIK